ncbi:JAB domain-containing protein [Pseudoalteromonas galatheae]|uniref:JAB domain-containing protein n=1 Tax=Pseudoalteromonas galatheae TaxID=579562 RepID=UPI0030CF5179
MLSESQNKIVKRAFNILLKDSLNGEPITDDTRAAEICQLSAAKYEKEVFGVLFLNNQNQLIAHEILFTGCLTSASVYPRQVLTKVLHYSASCIIIFHNHPSGNLEFSMADRQITEKLVKGLSLFDVRILDHVLVTKSGTTSMAKYGLI